MIIALTGTPGTGKTTVCRMIREHRGYSQRYHIIDVNDIVFREKMYSGKDDIRDTYEADMDRLEIRIKKEIERQHAGMNVIIEGHLSHFFPVDGIIVLRAHPLALCRRLGKRKNYSPKKIRENTNAEALDVVLVEATEKNNNVFEIDTTNIDAQAVLESIVSIIEDLQIGKIPEEFLPGKINWIELVEVD